MKCPYCGHELREDDKYCSNCAAPVSLSNNAQSSLEPDSKLHAQDSLHRTAKPAPLALIACVLLSAAVVLFFVSTFINWQRGRRLEQALSQNTSGESGSGSDYNYINDKGCITIGITNYYPFAMLDEKGNPEAGFDIELIRAVFEVLGYDRDFVQFVEINWDDKLDLLNEKTIDCIWNALPITEENKAVMEMSIPYAKSTDNEEKVEVGVGFRKGSDFCQYINNALKQCEADGTIDRLGEIYGVAR